MSYHKKGRDLEQPGSQGANFLGGPTPERRNLNLSIQPRSSTGYRENNITFQSTKILIGYYQTEQAIALR